VDVILHQRPRVARHFAIPKKTAQAIEEEESVAVVREYVSPLYASRHNVVN